MRIFKALAWLGQALAVATLVAACGGSGSSSDDEDTSSGSAPTITTQPASQTIASGATATLSVVATGSGTLAYQWLLDGSVVSGATSASLTTGTAGSYTVVVSNDAGSVTSEAAEITVTASGDGSTAWNLSTGAYAPDGTDTSGWLRLTLDLDTMTLSSSSTRLVVGSASGSSTPVTLDGSAAITVTEDEYGVTIDSAVSGDTHVALVLTGSARVSVTVYADDSFALVLADATIASPDGPAINIQSKKTAFVELDGTNTLTGPSTWSDRTLADGSEMDLKAAFFSEGALVISGSGSLEVTAAAKHALASDAHVRLVSGTVTLTAASKDGLRAKHAFVMDGGSLAVTTAAGKGIKVEGEEDDSQPLGFIAINDGTLTITSYDKAITASWEGDEDGETTSTADDPDPRVTINGGAITIATTGTPYEDGDDSLSPEGIEAKSVLTINGGTIVVESTDDALNAGSSIVVNGGRIYAASSSNDAVDSNGTMAITGGIVVASGASGAEGGLDCDENSFTVSGGVFVGLGGRNSTVTASSSTQNTVSARNVTAGQWTLRDASGNAAFSFTVPQAASAMVLGSPLITTGTTYSVVTGGTLGTVGETFHGLAIEPTTHSGGTTGTSFTVRSTVTSL